MSELCPKAGISNIKPHMLSDTSNDYPPTSIALNSNESAFGPSQLAIEAARAACSNLSRYLENPSRILASALGEQHGLDANRITIGNGSDDLLARLARIYLDDGYEMIRSRNGYLKTPNYAFANNATPVAASDDEFTTSVDGIINCLTDRTRMVYIANPENPAGTYLSGAEIRRLHQALPAHVLLVLDCAYEEYVDATDYEAGHRLAADTENVVVTHTFSKIYGLAGARLGWLYGASNIVDLLDRIGLTFPVSSPAVAACLAGLGDQTHIKQVAKTNRYLRDEFSNKMKNLGIKVYPSQTNFVLLEFLSDTNSAAECDAYLRRRGIAIRRFAAPSYQNCIRVTIGFESEMNACAVAITKYMELT